MKKICALLVLTILFSSTICFAGISTSKIKGKWSLTGVADTIKSKAKPWQYTPMAWEFINNKDMKYIYGSKVNKLTFKLDGNNIKMNMGGVVTTYTVKKIGSSSMIWHNPAMNNYYHLQKKK